jgi:transglutaminase-like putative cysteine protease
VNSYLVYRASFYLMLTVATLALSGEATESRFAPLYPLGVTAAGLVAFFTVDRRSRWALSRPVANALALLTLGVLWFEYRLDDTQLIRALGHWLVYLQLIKYFLPKTAEDDWFLFLLGLMQVLIGAVISQSDQVGMWLFGWAMLAIWVLGQFFLQREAGRFAPEPAAARPPVLRAGAVDPYSGLFDLPYAVATARVLVTTLALGGLIFLTLPRQAGATRSQPGEPAARHLTGFDEEVALGQFGEILENDTVVMTVEFADEDGKTIGPPGEPLWRGVTMLRYETGRWRRQTQRSSSTVVAPPERGRRRTPLIQQKIKLESNDSPTLFAMRPIRDWSAPGRRVQPYLNPIDGTLYRPVGRGGTYDYQILSDPDPESAQPGEQPPSFTHTELLLAMPEALRLRLRALAEPIVGRIPGRGREATVARARALEAHLRDSGLFGYSLHMDVVDPDLDPVEDFLVNRKEGHCEYFASALALLLRSIDIPARLVNGFKGGDWNDLTQTMNVRQKHAHSWVEAFVDVSSQKEAIWLTLDPTPGAERARSVAQVGGLAGNFRPFTDLVRHIWVFYIVGYDGDRQNRLLYAPMRQMIGWVRTKYAELGRLLHRGFAIFHFQSLGAFISLRGFIVTFFLLSLVAAGAHLLYRLGLRLLRWYRGPVPESTSLTAGILFYRRLVQVLAHLELERTPAETQGEFALRAAKVLTGHGPDTQPVADVPQQVVDAFYRVRFGHLKLEPASLQELDARLDALEASLNPGH